MSKSPEHPRLFERLKAGLEEGIRFARGEQALVATDVSSVTPDQIVALRKRLKLTPSGLAAAMMVEPAVIEKLEAGAIPAEGPVLRLLEIFLSAPKLASRTPGGGAVRTKMQLGGQSRKKRLAPKLSNGSPAKSRKAPST